MLKIINNLKPFFEDCYRRINVREYARIMKISPPTASKLLARYKKEGLLKKEDDRIYINYFANKDNKTFIDLSRIYWSEKLKELVDHLDNKLLDSVLVLFGSLSKAEVNKNSDIDLAIFTLTKKEIDINSFEKKLGRRIQIFRFSERSSVSSQELLSNILHGYILRGNW